MSEETTSKRPLMLGLIVVVAIYAFSTLGTLKIFDVWLGGGLVKVQPPFMLNVLSPSLCLGLWWRQEWGRRLAIAREIMSVLGIGAIAIAHFTAPPGSAPRVPWTALLISFWIISYLWQDDTVARFAPAAGQNQRRTQIAAVILTAVMFPIVASCFS